MLYLVKEVFQMLNRKLEGQERKETLFRVKEVH